MRDVVNVALVMVILSALVVGAGAAVLFWNYFPQQYAW